MVSSRATRRVHTFAHSGYVAFVFVSCRLRFRIVQLLSSVSACQLLWAIEESSLTRDCGRVGIDQGLIILGPLPLEHLDSPSSPIGDEQNCSRSL